MSQRDHWKKKRPAPGSLSEQKSWLSAGTAGRGEAARQPAEEQGGSPQTTQQGLGRR